MQIYVANTLTVKKPTPDMVAWCKRNLIIPNPEYAKKSRMGFWTGNTPKTLSLYETNGDDLILPFGTLSCIPKEILHKAKLISKFEEPKHLIYIANVPLYDYQGKAVTAMMKAYFGILQSPAGSGKTQMGIALAVRWQRKTLWLCHTLDLVKQSRDRALQYISPDLIGTIASGKVNIGKAITFATIQTMSELDLSRYKNEWDVIIVDEVHRVSGTPSSMTRYEKVLNALSARHKYGLSATVHRADGMIKATYSIIGKVAYQVPDEEIADKIMEVGIFSIGTGIEISRKALNTDGTLNYTRLITYLTENEERNKVLVNWLQSHSQYSSLILSDRLEHLKELIELLSVDMQKNAVMISGKMTSKTGKEERQKALDDMRSGKKKYLFATYSLAKEGLDIPCLERLYLTTPQKDYAVVAQSVGRIARVHEGKANPLVYDFVDNIGYTARAWKKRCTTYRKIGCYFAEEDS